MGLTNADLIKIAEIKEELEKLYEKSTASRNKTQIDLAIMALERVLEVN